MGPESSCAHPAGEAYPDRPCARQMSEEADERRSAWPNASVRRSSRAPRWMRRRLGRGLTAEELQRVLRRYPGDMAYRRREQPVESIRYFAREIEGGGAEPGVVQTVMTDA